MLLFVTRRHLVPPRRGIIKRKLSKALFPPGRTAKALRLTGLALYTMALFICIQIGLTDIKADFSQKALKTQWVDVTSRTRNQTPASTTPSTPPSRHGGTVSNQNARKDTPSMSSAIRETPEGARSRPQIEAQKKIQHDPIPPGQPFARIVIPKIGLDTIIVEGVSEDSLALGPGHMEGTGYPGEYGNMVVSGHRVTYSHPFYRLDELKAGDAIDIYAGTKKFTYYVIEGKVVSPTDIRVTDPTQDKTLTLTTCNPRFSASTRLVVVAKAPKE